MRYPYFIRACLAAFLPQNNTILLSRIFGAPKDMLLVGQMIRKDRFEPAHEGLSFLFLMSCVEPKCAYVDV